MDYVIVGLGNPGPEYELTRHNLGFWTVDQVAKKIKCRFTEGSGEFFLARKSIRGQSVALVKPTTYMNLIGHVVMQLVDQYGIALHQLLVVCDDFALEEGRIRIRRQGSDGGHNGLKSIISELGTQQFARIRLGIGPVPAGVEPADFVLAKIEKTTINTLRDLADRAAQAVIECVTQGVDLAANAYNIRPSAPPEDADGAERPKEV